MNERSFLLAFHYLYFDALLLGQHRRERPKIRLRSKNKNLKNTSLLGILLPKSNWRRQKTSILSLSFCGAIISIQYMIAHRHIASQGEKTLHLHNIFYSVDKCKHCAVRTEIYNFYFLKVPKCEIFDLFFTSINPLWVGDLRTGEKKNFSKTTADIRHFFFFYAGWACAKNLPTQAEPALKKFLGRLSLR